MINPVSFYMAVLRPKTVWSGIIRSTPTDPYMTILFAQGSRVTGTYDVTVNQTVWFGSGTEQNNIGMARLRSFDINTFESTTGTFTVGENSDVTPYVASGTYLTIKEEFRLWSIYPRILQTGGVALFYEDYDIPYTDDNNIYPPQAVAPPPAVAFMNKGTGTVSFVGDRSFTLSGAGMSYLWTANGSIEGTSTAVGTEASPVVFNWTTPGTYTVSLRVTDSGNGKTHIAYTTAFIFNRNSQTLPNNQSFYTEFDQVQVGGDYQRGGYEGRITVNGNFTTDYFPDGSAVVVFADGDLANRTSTFPHRSNILFAGFITKGSVVKDWRKNIIQFSVSTIDGLLRNLTMYPAKLSDETATTNWTHFSGLNIAKVLRFLSAQRSTLSAVTTFPAFGSTLPIKSQDVGAGNFWSILTKLAADSLGYIAVSMQGVLMMQRDYQLMLSQERAQVTNRRTLTEIDWVDNAEVSENHYWGQPVNTVKADGILYLGGGSSASGVALFSIAPGVAAHNTGQTSSRSGLILSSQSELNARTGRLLAKLNNPYPVFGATFINTGEFDLIPQETFQLTASVDRVSFVGTKVLPRRVNHTFNHRQGIIKSRVDFEPETFGRTGTTVIMPVPTTPGRPNPAPPPGNPPPPKPQPPRYAPILISAIATE